MDEARGVWDEIWSHSIDHRSLVFQNSTDLWIEVIGTFRPRRGGSQNGPPSDNEEGGGQEASGGSSATFQNFSSESRIRVQPRSTHSWKFLGESAQLPTDMLAFELLGLLPDSYDMAIRHDFTFVAKSLCETDIMGQGEDLRILLGDKASLSLRSLPLLGPGEESQITLSCKNPVKLQYLCRGVILNTLDDPVDSNLLTSEHFRDIHLKTKVDQLPLPLQIKKFYIQDLIDAVAIM